MIKLVKTLIQSYLLNQEVVIPETKDLSGFVVIITGASHGLGKAIAQVLIRQNASVVLVSRDKNKLQKVFTQKNDTILFVQSDITLESGCRKVVSETLQRFGKVDVLINNAGQFIESEFDQVSLKQFESILGINLKAVFLMTKTVLPIMKKRRDGFIINIGSKVSHNTNVASNKVMYATTKYALEGMSFALNKELKKYSIRVSCLMPGTMSTYPRPNARGILSAYQVGSFISTMIKFQNVDFEGVVIKAKQQDI